jgi:hypothetical protein
VVLVQQRHAGAFLLSLRDALASSPDASGAKISGVMVGWADPIGYYIAEEAKSGMPGPGWNPSAVTPFADLALTPAGAKHPWNIPGTGLYRADLGNIPVFQLDNVTGAAAVEMARYNAADKASVAPKTTKFATLCLLSSCPFWRWCFILYWKHGRQVQPLRRREELRKYT